MARVYIGVGSNIDPETSIPRALRKLRDNITITRISTFYRTPPLDRPEQSSFINGVVAGETTLEPLELKFNVLRRIEESLGRMRNADKYAPRSIDLDILLYNNTVVATEKLTLPDPEIRTRPFIAIPLAEIAPDLLLPGTGECITRIAAEMSPRDMEPLAAFTALLRKELLDESQAS